MNNRMDVDAHNGLTSVRAWLRARLEALGVSPAFVHDCSVIMDEYAANLNMHGTDSHGVLRWSLEVFRNDDTLLLRFKDNGREFDPTRYNTFLTESRVVDGSNGGLGLLLIKELSDRLEYRHCDGQNCLDVKIHLTGKS